MRLTIFVLAAQDYLLGPTPIPQPAQEFVTLMISLLQFSDQIYITNRQKMLYWNNSPSNMLDEIKLETAMAFEDYMDGTTYLQILKPGQDMSKFLLHCLDIRPLITEDRVNIDICSVLAGSPSGVYEPRIERIYIDEMAIFYTRTFSVYVQMMADK